MRFFNFKKTKTKKSELDQDDDKNSLHVLFIEDDPNDLELIKYYLKEGGYKPEYDCVDQEADFLDCIETNTYDIIIADFQLPGWTGLDAYKMLKETGDDTPLLLVTGAVGDDRAVDCLKEGISDYILKDNLAKLPLEISRILHERHLLNKYTTAAMHESEAQIQTILDGISLHISYVNNDSDILWVNKACATSVGRSPDEMIGHKCYEFWGDMKKPGIGSPDAEVFQTRQSQRTTIDSANGKVWEKISEPLFDPDGRISGVVVITQDITQRKHEEAKLIKRNEKGNRADEALSENKVNYRVPNETLEQRIIEQTAELAAINREHEAFIYSVSHDLQAPMRHISGFNSIMLSKYSDQLPDEAKEYLRKINESVVYMNDLIGGLLTLSRASRREMNIQPVDINIIVDKVRQELEPDLEDRDIEWQIDELPEILCDSDMIKIVITNLLLNAVKFTGKEDHAVITVSPLPDAEPGFVVRDNGVGFDMKNHDKIFNVFQRLHQREEFEGTGVGLATVHRIIAKHKGCVWAEAEVDKGAAFYVKLPGPKKQ
jgi:PAS domain S-box-containing protein